MTPPLTSDDAAAAWRPAFPSPELVGLAADQFADRLPGWDGSEGPRWRVEVAAGTFAVATRDVARAERTAEAVAQRGHRDADMRAAQFIAEGEWPDDPAPTREVTAWSRKSRANMVRRLAELDYGPLFADPTRAPAMLTLTYPADWRTVAPDGRTVKDHLLALIKRYGRAWGEALWCVWKLEFQRRGAPHFHLLIVPPHGLAGGGGVGAGLPFKAWIGVVWADVVAHPDPEERRKHEDAGTNISWSEGMRARDPRRLAVYFAKHGSAGAASKEYQHVLPPEWREPGRGPGRWWGYRGLERVCVAVELAPDAAIAAARVARRWARAQRTTRVVRVPRTAAGRPLSAYAEVQGLAGADVAAGAPRARTRAVRRRTARLARGRGWVAVNDGAAFASAVARAVEIAAGRGEPETMFERRARLVAATGSARPPRVVDLRDAAPVRRC